MNPTAPIRTNQSRQLNDLHRAEYHASGINDATIKAAGIFSANGEIIDILGWRPPGQRSWGEGWVVPYQFPSEAVPSYCRVKLDHPRHDEDSKKIKYESPRGKSNRAYFPPGAAEAIKSGEVIIITEGEKKTLKVFQEGFVAIGLPGVWSWQAKRKRTDTGRAYGQRELIPDLLAIEWKGKTVYIVFDSDAATNTNVQLAESRLAECLTAAGATVLVVRLPSVADGKTGLDDFLVACGVDAFRELLQLAQPAETPKPPAPMDWARMYVEDQFTTPDGITLRWYRDEFYAWDRRRYRVIPASELKAILMQWLDQRTTVTPKLAADVLICLASEVRVAFDIEQPALLADSGPSNPDWIVLNENIFDLGALLRTGTAIIHRHTPKLFTPIALPYSYREEAKCPIWFQTLEQIFNGDDECFQLLAEWFGYNLTDDTSHQSIMMFEGPPRSGKGTVLRTLRLIVGKDNCVSPRFATLGETFGLMGLVNKRAAICPDAHLGHGDKGMATMELLKLISGEDAIEIHRKNLPPITMRLRIKFTLAVNELPKFGDNAGAMASRLLILPFRNSFLGREDRQLEEKIAAEAEGILNWSLWGLKRLRDNGRFTKPKISEQIERDFARLSSPVKAFLEDCCEIEPAETVDRDSLWSRWSEWCQRNGHLAGSRDVLGSRLRILVPGISESRPRIEGERQRVYVGLGLKT